ncbi:Protein kinase domain [Macleaya cordata]|uniref:Protein kinase domain n=1 Tax=Macleaya cordata TaxID=56857 RepID=A0A200RDJ4_MACCD|nr:Protein kinase domain [Macleaya cordata]
MKKAFPNVSLLLLLLLLVLSLLVVTTISEPRDQVVEMKCGRDREANSSIFIVNFVATMENISEQMRTNGYGEAVVGTGPNANFGLAQCYGDLILLDCVLCYAKMRTLLPQCYPYSSGHIYLDGCFMRVTNYSFYEEIRGPDDKAICGNATQKSTRFQESARKAVLDAAAMAPRNGGYAKSQALVSGSVNESAYVLANCWRRLNSSSCKACLDNAAMSVMGCLPWSEGRALNTGCFMRYSDIDFLNAEQQQQSSSGSSKAKIVYSQLDSQVEYIFSLLNIFYPCFLDFLGRTDDAVKMAKILHDSSLNFKFSVLQKATGSFDEANRLGQGGFGTVYKGVLADGREIAVKRLFFNNKHRAADFYNEVNIISSVEHKNLVRLLGCSCSGPESLLVYEFLPNKSLDRFLFDPNRGKALHWEKRFEIVIGTAEGLAYLHENSNNRIIHRDIKASNILLDSKLKAKIADFGLARSFQEDKSHISTAIAGTLGYMAPEYLAHGQLTEKADVYSFGVLLLEIVTGRQNNRSKTLDYSDSLITAAWKHFQLGTAEELFDPNLMLHNYNSESDMKKDILRVVHVGLLCTQEIPSLRPFMSKALEMLLNKDHILPAPTNPPFIDESTMELNDNSSDPSHPLNATSSPSVASMSHSSFYPR